jgi:hypothetical protein
MPTLRLICPLRLKSTLLTTRRKWHQVRRCRSRSSPSIRKPGRRDYAYRSNTDEPPNQCEVLPFEDLPLSPAFALGDRLGIIPQDDYSDKDIPNVHTRKPFRSRIHTSTLRPPTKPFAFSIHVPLEHARNICRNWVVVFLCPAHGAFTNVPVFE